MKNKKLFIFLGFGLIIMAVMLYFIGIDEVIEALKLSNLWFVLLAVILQVFTYYLYTLRWHIINKTADMSLGIKKLLPMVLVSLAVNNMTPSGRGGGEPVRAYILAKEGKYPFEDTFATVIADRALDTFPFVILAILTIIGIILSFSLDITWIVLLVACVVAITMLVVLLIYVCVNRAFGVKLTRWIIRIVKRFYKKFDEGTEKRIVEAVMGFQSTMNNLIRDKSIIYYALPLSFIIWIFEILRVYTVFLAFGAHVSPVVIGEVFILASLVGMIPLLPGGLGAVDGIMILFYSRAGITPSISAAATVVERLISFWMTTFLGFIVLPMYGASVLDRSMELAESQENQEPDVSDELLDEIREDLDEDSDEDSDVKSSEEDSLTIEEVSGDAVSDDEESDGDDQDKEVLEEKV